MNIKKLNEELEKYLETVEDYSSTIEILDNVCEEWVTIYCDEVCIYPQQKDIDSRDKFKFVYSGDGIYSVNVVYEEYDNGKEWKHKQKDIEYCIIDDTWNGTLKYKGETISEDNLYEIEKELISNCIDSEKLEDYLQDNEIGYDDTIFFKKRFNIDIVLD